MIRCQRCGNELPDTVSICPRCGGAISSFDQPPQPFTQYPGQAAVNYGPSYQPHPGGYSNYPPVGVNVTVVNPPSQKNTGALVAEILLACFLGLYGIGWLISGETTVGLVLLLASIFAVWPLAILIAIFTLGIGFCFIWPLLIVCVIIDAILLNKKLDQKAMTQAMVMRSQNW